MTDYGPFGTLDRRPDQNVITFTRSLRSSPDRVWRALTTSEGLTSWLAPTAHIEPGIGGAVRLTYDDDNRVTGVITAWEPPTHLAHTWVINNDAHSAVTYTLHATVTGTELTLEHARIPDEMAGGYTPGWHAYLVRLDAVLDDTEPPEWWDVFEVLMPQYRART